MARVFAAELRLAFITDAKPGRAGVKHIDQHQLARILQPQQFLVLHRRHRGDRLEMVVQRRRTHVDVRGQFIDAQLLRKMLPDPADRAPDAVGLAFRRGHMAQPRAVGAGQQVIGDFLADQRRQHRNRGWRIEQAQQPQTTVEQTRRQPADRHAAFTWRGNRLRADLVHCFGQLQHIDIEHQAQMRLLRRRLGHLRHHRQTNRRQQVFAGAVMERFGAQHRALGPLHDEGQSRLVVERHRLVRRRAAVQAQAVDRRFKDAIGRQEPGDQGTDFAMR